MASRVLQEGFGSGVEATDWRPLSWTPTHETIESETRRVGIAALLPRELADGVGEFSYCAVNIVSVSALSLYP